MNSSFETKVTGKWILAGEHAVLRGCPALVFPLYSRSLQLTHLEQPLDTGGERQFELSLLCEGEFGDELQLLFWGVLEKACELKNIRRQDFYGTVKLHSSLPLGAGLGASAALCGAVAKWFCFLKIIQAEEAYEFARTLENLFHGESSGVDIAVALSGKGLRFIRGQEHIKFEPQWQPRWFVSYSGKRGVTKECVKKVKELISADGKLGSEIDQQMQQAVELAEKALHANSKSGLPQLIESMNLAKSCFHRWGLTEGALEQHMQMLMDHGALAVKPTGSGGGGYVLSLWSESPPVEIEKSLISCF